MEIKGGVMMVKSMMMKRSRVSRLGLVVVVAMTFIAATPSLSSAAKPKTGGNITWAFGGSLALDPKNGMNSLNSASLVLAVYDQLWTYDTKTGAVIPRLASSITKNRDATVWTIKLRKHLQFTDGTALDAAAVVANWNRLVAPATACLCASTMKLLTWGVGDPLTVRVTFPAPHPSFGPDGAFGILSAMTVIASPAALTAYGTAYGTSPASIVGAGAFKVTDMLAGDHFTMVKNPNYWDKPLPYLNQITFRIVSDPLVRANALISGDAQIGFYPVLDANTKRLSERSSGVNALGGSSSSPNGLMFNPNVVPFNDVRIRRALMLATDFKELNVEATLGQEKPVVSTWFPRGSPFASNQAAFPKSNLKKAQKLIDSYIAEKGPISPAVLLMPTALQTFATALGQQWAKLKGITVTMNVVPDGQYGGLVQRGACMVCATSAPMLGYVQPFYDSLFSGSSRNILKVSDPELDKLLIAGLGAVTTAAREHYVTQITKHILNQGYMFPITYGRSITFYSSKLTGVQLFWAGATDPAFVRLK